MRTVPAAQTTRRIRRGLAAMVIAITGAVATSGAIAPQAQAQSACAGKLCVYEHNNYGGRYVAYATGSSDMSRFGPYFNDMTSSIRNNTGSRWCAYAHANYVALLLYVQPWSSYPSIGSANDRISSIRRC